MIDEPHFEPPPSVLDAAKIIRTVDRLAQRIDERFPHSGLHRVSQQLLTIAQQTKERSEAIARPILWLRIVIGLLVLLILLGILGTIARVDIPRGGLHFFDFVQALEASINDIVLIGAGIFFLITLENRIKRGRAMRALHELRAIAHVIDMHQLTKDPDRLLVRLLETPASPQQTMTPYELSRYLDYCTELLSLTGKIAALYIQEYDDAQVSEAVNEIELLTTGLARKIWQKLMIVHSVYHETTK
ncbi:MAG: hypothetical protein R3A44_37020 [Caldilineaceae bacterium]